MTPAPESQRHIASFAEQYPEQTRMMKSHLRKQGVLDARIEDMVSEAWTRALETFNAEHGLHHVQWAWYILQHNLLPSYGRNRKAGKEATTLVDDPPDQPAESLDEDVTAEQQRLLLFLQTNLPTDLLQLLNAMQEATAEADSPQIYDQVAAHLHISMKQCRTMVKRLKRTCVKLRNKYTP